MACKISGCHCKVAELSVPYAGSCILHPHITDIFITSHHSIKLKDFLTWYIILWYIYIVCLHFVLLCLCNVVNIKSLIPTTLPKNSVSFKFVSSWPVSGTQLTQKRSFWVSCACSSLWFGCLVPLTPPAHFQLCFLCSFSIHQWENNHHHLNIKTNNQCKLHKMLLIVTVAETMNNGLAA